MMRRREQLLIPHPERTATLPSNPLAGDEIIGQRQPRLFLPTLVLSWFGSAIMMGAINGASIPKFLAVLDDASKESNLGLISSAGGVVIVLTTPLLGRLSDRTTSSWGMRKPWYLFGILVSAVAVMVLSISSSVAGMVFGWCILQVGSGAIQMVNHTLLADQVASRIRARVAAAASASSGIATIAAVVIVAALPIDAVWAWFAVPGALGLSAAVPLLFSYADARRMTPPAPLRFREILSTYWLNPIRYRDFTWAWSSRFFMSMAILSVSLYLFFLIMETLDFTAERAGSVQATAMVFFVSGNIAAALFFGWLSDRLGRRKVIVCISALLVATGVVVVMLSPDIVSFYSGFAIVGLALGAYISVDVALLTEVLPSREEAGKDLGIVALSYQLPQIIGPAAATVCITLAGGYTGLYAFALVCSLLAMVAVIPVRGVR